MYEKTLNLESDPFKLSPSSRPCYEHKSFRRAVAYLHFALKRREGIVVLTGTPGTGKTSLLRQLTDTLVDPEVTLGQIVCSSLDADDLLRAVAIRFDVEPDGLKKSQLYESLAERFAAMWEHGRRAILLVDDAQGLTLDALEELRTLTNLQRGENMLLQVFLAGQQSLMNTLRTPQLEQLHQRIVVACHLDPLSVDEVRGYVNHCLVMSGYEGEALLDSDVFQLIQGESSGIPRRINLIMSRLLLRGMVQQRWPITRPDTEAVLSDLRREGLLSSQAWKMGASTENVEESSS